MRSVNSRIRRDYESLMMPAGNLLCRLHVSPNWISLFALGLAGGACAGFASGRLGLGLGLVLGSILVDMLDGSVARAGGRASPFGMVVDHTTDRYAEFLYVFGLCYGGFAPFWLGFVCVFSMMMPSYVRCKIESAGVGVSCQGVGVAERKEKMAILVASIVLAFFVKGAVVYGLVAIAVLSQISALQRLYHGCRGEGPDHD